MRINTVLLPLNFYAFLSLSISYPSSYSKITNILNRKYSHLSLN